MQNTHVYFLFIFTTKKKDLLFTEFQQKKTNKKKSLTEKQKV